MEITPTALAKSLELMRKAGLADEAAIVRGTRVVDDSYRLQALKTLGA
jgi:hypothetical protein